MEFVDAHFDSIVSILVVVAGLVLDGLNGYSKKSKYVGLVRRLIEAVIKKRAQ